MIAALKPPKSVAKKPTEQGDPLAYLSASRLKSYLTCPLRFYFEKVLQIKKPTSPAAHLGKAVHAGLATYHTALWRGGDTSADFIAGRFTAEFAKLEEAQPVRWVDDERAESLANGGRLIRAYLDDETPRHRPKPIGVEVKLEATIPGIPIRLVGVADLIHTGNRLTDFKTTGVTPNPVLEAWQHELQLTAYDLLIEENTGDPVSESELVWLVKTKTPKIIRQVLPAPDEVKRSRFAALAEVYVRGVERKDYHPAPGQHCAWCQFRNECGKWKGGSASC
jgi:putative RecB family exonuclease